MSLKKPVDRGDLIVSARTTVLSSPMGVFLGLLGIVAGVIVSWLSIKLFQSPFPGEPEAGVAVVIFGIAMLGAGILCLVGAFDGSKVETIDFYQRGVSFGGRREESKFTTYEKLREISVTITTDAEDSLLTTILKTVALTAAGLSARRKPTVVVAEVVRGSQRVKLKSLSEELGERIGKLSSKTREENTLTRQNYSF